MESFDAVVVGGGPAGLAAGLYLARAGVNVAVYECAGVGGALLEIDKIANYPGFEGEGKVLAENMKAQAKKVGAKVEYGECSDVRKVEGGFELEVDGDLVFTKKVLFATGSEPRKLDFELETPVSYCALCDADLVKGQNVAVVGGGNSAVQEALYLAGIVRNVTIVTHSELKADAVLKEKLREAGNISVRENEEPTPEGLNGFDRVFVYIGKKPATGCLQGLDQEFDLLDEQGYIKTVTGKDGETKIHQTAVPGIFAAGDVRQGSVHQVVTAVSEGAAAAIEMVN